MTKIAFYAPLKPPSHPVPSGDRAMARALIQALEMTGRSVSVASELRSYDGRGDGARQTELIARASEELDHLIGAGREAGWTAWLTYHCYYKAPDLIGPAVVAALDIPYVLIEATRARKRLTGPWAGFAEISERACDAANAILYFTERDGEALIDRAPSGQMVQRLRPFLPLNDLPPASDLCGPMLSVGMFRSGDKLESYRLIAETLGQLRSPDWRLDIAGDGPERGAIEAVMNPFGDKVRLLGELTPAELRASYIGASLLFWPGVNEAFGLAYLEAQAAGLPVVAQDRPGVRDVLAPGVYPAPDQGTAALAKAIDSLLSDPELRKARGSAARRHIRAHHMMDAAAETLDATLRQVGA